MNMANCSLPVQLHIRIPTRTSISPENFTEQTWPEIVEFLKDLIRDPATFDRHQCDTAYSWVISLLNARFQHHLLTNFEGWRTISAYQV
jgi:hypothetical protein